MCKWNTTTVLNLKIPAKLSSTGKDKMKLCDVDSCIALIVKALNDAGITTICSCCGHEMGFGSIVLEDGRELLICPDYQSARKIDSLWDKNIHGNKIND